MQKKEYINKQKTLLENGKPYSLLRYSQCATFACEVAETAGIDLGIPWYKRTPKTLEKILKEEEVK